ncbi:DivIVA domain-containing protein [Cytophagales bacterium LB-30]|uniref:DivIVA domain-containing protein n=1 Tax=Shiella aurantiaca TaxID=3058365 RepID=A0ABT8F7T5_9BACT|nr:DivIVA domain-containing protein [Shiella aurantiaca]MDN4166515.1 DivIVA domain-containing protein [Shiella aurantiaca]
MKITPIEIRQKEFEKVFRGYDKEEVDAYLQSLSQEWERLLDETKELKMRLEVTEKEVVKLREVESTLFKTLKTAEDTGANMIQQANKTAELHLKETQIKAEALLNDAKFKAKSIIEEAETQSRYLIDEMEHETRTLLDSCHDLEVFRDNLISELKNLANDTQMKAKKVEEKSAKSDLNHIVSKLKALQKQYNERTEESPRPSAKPKEEPSSAPSEPTVEEEAPRKENSGSQSFFDQIG